MLTIGSLFSGVGGLERGLELAGLGKVIFQAECDPYCLKVLEKHWPGVKRYETVEDIGEWSPERPDLIVGGFPCQPFSLAGKRAGEDDRRNMWPETIRIIRALGPRFVLLENVPGLLAHEYFGQILGELSESGYDAEWRTLSAAAIGAPHKRERLFIVAYRRGERRQQVAGSAHGDETPDERWAAEYDYIFAGNGKGPVAHGNGGRLESERLGGVFDGERATPGNDADGRDGPKLANAEHGRRQGRVKERKGAGAALPFGEELANGDLQGPEVGGGVGEDARSKRAPAERSGDEMGDATRELHDGTGNTGPGGRREHSDASGEELANPKRGGHAGRPPMQGRGPEERATTSWPSEWPPPPGDVLTWNRIEPALQPAVPRNPECHLRRVAPRLPEGLHERVKRLRALGNAVVPAVSRYIGERIREAITSCETRRHE